MADYIWDYHPLGGPRVGVTEEPKGSIFLKDPQRPYKAWWNGCGIAQGTKTLEESKKIALTYARDYAIKVKQAAIERVESATKAIADLDNLLK